MKYCGECGNQLMDEAVRCPKCGASATAADDLADKISRASGEARLKSAAALNHIAGILNVLIGSLLGWSLFGTDSVNSGNESDGFSITLNSGKGETPSPELFWLWLAAILFVYAIGLYTQRQIRLGKGSKFSYAYMFSAILSVIIMFCAFPGAMNLVFCFVGIIFFVPAILQIMAGVKMVQSA